MSEIDNNSSSSLNNTHNLDSEEMANLHQQDRSSSSIIGGENLGVELFRRYINETEVQKNRINELEKYNRKYGNFVNEVSSLSKITKFVLIFICVVPFIQLFICISIVNYYSINSNLIDLLNKFLGSVTIFTISEGLIACVSLFSLLKKMDSIEKRIDFIENKDKK